MSGAGNDVMGGGGGNDVLIGGAGNDAMSGDALVEGALYVDAQGHPAIISQGSYVGVVAALGTQAFLGVLHPGNDFLDGGVGNDTLIGDGGNDNLLMEDPVTTFSTAILRNLSIPKCCIHKLPGTIFWMGAPATIPSRWRRRRRYSYGWRRERYPHQWKGK